MVPKRSDLNHAKASHRLRRLTVVGAGLGLVMAVLFGVTLTGQGCHGGCPYPAASPDATPPQENGVTTEAMAFVVPDAAPDDRLELVRITIAPGGNTRWHEVYPGARVIYVESGALTFTRSTREQTEGSVQVLAADSATPVENFEGGFVYTLTAGDRVVQDGRSEYDFENSGDEPAVLWVASLTPPDATPSGTTDNATPNA